MADSDEHALLLQMSFDLNRLQQQTGKAQGILDTGLTGMERRAKKAAASLEESLSLKGANFEGALAEVFSASRLKVLDTGAAKVGLFGGALEALGPIGLGAAAGIGAFGAAVENSVKTADWALELTHAAGALGLTTTQLQKFDFIASAAGIPVDKMRESMAGLEKTIGNVESGLARSMSVKAFTDGLKIKPEDLRGWGDLEHQLPHIVEAASKLNVEERAGLAQRLKIDPEVLNSLIEMKDRLGDASDAASQFGVMSAADVKHAADVAAQMKLTSAVIDSQFRMAFVNLSPAVLAAEGLVARFASGLVNLERNAVLTGLAIKGMFQTFGGLTGDPFAGVKSYFANQAKANADADKVPNAGGPPTQLSFPKAPKAKRGRADNPQASSEDLDQADKLLADAEKALATSIEARAKFEDQALDAEAKKAADKLAHDLKSAKTPEEKSEVTKAAGETAQAYVLKKQLLANQTAQALTDQANALSEIDIQGKVDMLDAQKALGLTTAKSAEVALQIFDLNEQLQAAKLQEVIASKTASDAEKARAAGELANLNATAPLRRKAVDNEGQQSVVDQQNAMAEIALQGQIEGLDAQKGLFQTTEKRRDLALQLFQLDEQLQELKLQEIIASKTATDAEKQRAAAELANLQSTAGARAQATSQANPGNSWDAWLSDAKNATADVGEEFAKMKVDGIDAFNASLINGQGKLQTFGQIARDVSKKMISDFEQVALKTTESAIFGGGQSNGGGGILSSLGGLFGLKGGSGGGGLLGGLFGGGKSKPDGSSGNPFHVVPATTGGGGLLSGLTGAQGGGQAGGGGGILSMRSGLMGGGGGGLAAGGNSLGGQLASAGSAQGAGLMGGITTFLGGIGHALGFADGGSLMVGGQGGVDKNLAMLRVSKGEKINVQTPAQQAAANGGRHITQNFNFPGATVDGFKRTQRQVGKSMAMAAG